MTINEFIKNFENVNYRVIIEQHYYGIGYCELFRIYIYDKVDETIIEKILYEKSVNFSQIIYDEGKISESFNVCNIILNGPTIPVYKLNIRNNNSDLTYVFVGSLS